MPLLALLDFFATSIKLARDSRKAEFSELIRSHMSQSAVTALKLDIADKNDMFTASDYLASIDDGREVFVYGEKVLSVATHPVFRNSAQSIARLYSALHALASRDTMTTLRPERLLHTPLLYAGALIRRSTQSEVARNIPASCGLPP
ncbi:4-hydroxyphenylacetate 3-hydroxylase N-terminal domain-containing protein [Paraburkholderia terricola]|uniref:4-hydroxyphenylacetate 3-hydroxylase N-terminal domain-containing protein n=1 Tax=Paraburkholderia terricola TaxID=169427 RepID=UPI0028555C7F|nr:4-hydroxyphenylacetate 3-hydroxylase N-terminal domain-containing protein [Paraburkholderia terricola]MDR6450444.1 hypothetical protein [Paraburkholderia terricola]MDR6484876.1 hypothetical protein [Paraburkholderia terricola]